MQISEADIQRIADAVGKRSVVNLVNPPSSRADTLLTKNHQRIAQLVGLVEALSAQSGLTADQITAAAAKGVADALDNITINVDAGGH